jgi:hypothetical protein
MADSLSNTEPNSEVKVDPFSSLVLKCEKDLDPQDQLVLWWYSPTPPVRYQVEIELINVLIPYQKRERGMFCKQPEHRLRKLRRHCAAEGISLRMALSLRRHLIRRHNPNLSLRQLQLGTDEQVKEAARLYEAAVQDFLQRKEVDFYSEKEQKAHIRQHRQPGQPYPPTPDFVLKAPIRIRKYKMDRGNSNRTVIEELSVYCTWFQRFLHIFVIYFFYIIGALSYFCFFWRLQGLK